MKGRYRTLVEQHVQVALPHTTAQTIVVHWDRTPKTYQAECNGKGCEWPGSVARLNMADAQAFARAHHKENHS